MNLFYFCSGVTQGGAEVDVIWFEGFGVVSFVVGFVIVVAGVCCVVFYFFVA